MRAHDYLLTTLPNHAWVTSTDAISHSLGEVPGPLSVRKIHTTVIMWVKLPTPDCKFCMMTVLLWGRSACTLYIIPGETSLRHLMSQTHGKQVSAT